MPFQKIVIFKYHIMKRNNYFKLSSCIIIVILFIAIKNGYINWPGHGNLENLKFEETVVSHVVSNLPDDETVEFGSKFLCKNYKDNGKVRFSANVVYFIVSKDGVKKKHIAHVICNENKDRIIEWRNINN